MTARVTGRVTAEASRRGHRSLHQLYASGPTKYYLTEAARLHPRELPDLKGRGRDDRRGGA